MVNDTQPLSNMINHCRWSSPERCSMYFPSFANWDMYTYTQTIVYVCMYVYIYIYIHTHTSHTKKQKIISNVTDTITCRGFLPTELASNWGVDAWTTSGCISSEADPTGPWNSGIFDAAWPTEPSLAVRLGAAGWNVACDMTWSFKADDSCISIMDLVVNEYQRLVGKVYMTRESYMSFKIYLSLHRCKCLYVWITHKCIFIIQDEHRSMLQVFRKEEHMIQWTWILYGENNTECEFTYKMGHS
jgi:hypothetical protein